MSTTGSTWPCRCMRNGRSARRQDCGLWRSDCGDSEPDLREVIDDPAQLRNLALDRDFVNRADDHSARHRIERVVVGRHRYPGAGFELVWISRVDVLGSRRECSPSRSSAPRRDPSDARRHNPSRQFARTIASDSEIFARVRTHFGSARRNHTGWKQAASARLNDSPSRNDDDASWRSRISRNARNWFRESGALRAIVAEVRTLHHLRSILDEFLGHHRRKLFENHRRGRPEQPAVRPLIHRVGSRGETIRIKRRLGFQLIDLPDDDSRVAPYVGADLEHRDSPIASGERHQLGLRHDHRLLDRTPADFLIAQIFCGFFPRMARSHIDAELFRARFPPQRRFLGHSFLSVSPTFA